MLRTLAAAAALTLVAAAAPQVSFDPMLEPGVPFPLAHDRARRITDLHYELRFAIPERPAEPVRGEATIRFHLSDATRPLALDFLPSRAGVTRASVPLGEAPEHLVIAPADLREGPNRITIAFTASDAALNRADEFMYTLFVPARARMAFPCFDQPDLKARYTLTLEIPAAWEAVTNGAEVSRADEGTTRRLRFAPTEPIPTYLFAFAAGKFQVEHAERDGRAFRMLHRETDAKKVARNRGAIFDLHAAALAWLEAYTAVPYPFPKFDFVLIPSFQFGGMEHPGAIFYNAPALFLDESATRNQELGRASLIAHETAHMWFGDLVTMRWFDDVWMKEVFANFMAAKIVNPSFPDINHELRFLYSHYPAAYEVDRTPGTNAIRQRLDNLNEAGSLYGAIIYQKAPIVMRQLEIILGETSLRDGLREYLRNHAFGNASWPDLIALLDARTPQDLAAWSRAWVEEAGRPEIEVELDVRDDRIASLAFVQRDPDQARGLTWNQQIEVVIGHGGHGTDTAAYPLRLDARRVELAAARGLPAPDFVLPTGGGIGYGGFRLPAASREQLLRQLHALADPLTRGSAAVTLWEEMLDGRIGAGVLFETLLRAVTQEPDELNVQRMLGYLREAYWTFLPPDRRAEVAPRLEGMLREGLDRAGTASLKSAWFGALRDTAVTPATLAWLTRVWGGEEQVDGLVLAEPDFITLSLELAVRGPKDWDALLDRQAARIENPDRKARFTFVRPALSPRQADRDAFFESLADVGNRRREPWVLEAVNYLHHPLRAEASERYIPQSLALLPELQRTGDIFFPKRWLDATLSGHSSVRAAALVRAHVAALPDHYPDRLRRIILSSSDRLMRASGAGPATPPGQS
jgi:aminopeptidase N